jgi:hypothetical protein
MNAAQPRDQAGRFDGAERFNVEDLPMIPAPAAFLLFRAPQRPLALVWADQTGRVAEYAAVLDVVPGVRDLVRISALGAQPVCARVIRYRIAHGCQRPLWLCPACTRRARYLFIGFRPNTETLIVGCRICLALRHRAQGGARTPKALLRTLAGLEPDVPLPRDLRIPTLMSSHRKDLRRFKNLAVVDAPDGSPSGVIS